jgi:type 1 glutamine amidotransferase
MTQNLRSNVTTRARSRRIQFALALLAVWLFSGNPLHAAGKLKALIVDGQNNHAVWPKSTVMMKQNLEDSGLFEVDVARTRYLWKAEREVAFLSMAKAGEAEMLKEPKADPDFKPDFSKYAVVISNFGWKAADWPEATRRALEQYVANGGGFVSVHAADNSWGDWAEFNKMIGLGGWGDRDEKTGPFVYYNAAGEIVRDTSPGKAGKHAPAHEFVVTIRDHEHPITKGLPDFWMHTKDECYSRLRGPGENLTILATGCDSPELQAAGRNEPILMTIQYHKGRVFHTTLGHDTEAFEGVGFITTFLRGTEWAATGKVTLPVPIDFTRRDKISARTFEPRQTATRSK